VLCEPWSIRKYRKTKILGKISHEITILVERLWKSFLHCLETMKLYAYILATSYGTTVRQKSHVLLMPCHHNITRTQYIFYYLYFDGLSFHFLQNPIKIRVLGNTLHLRNLMRIWPAIFWVIWRLNKYMWQLFTCNTALRPVHVLLSRLHLDFIPYPFIFTPFWSRHMYFVCTLELFEILSWAVKN
jgi:hypothetical protein